MASYPCSFEEENPWKKFGVAPRRNPHRRFRLPGLAQPSYTIKTADGHNLRSALPRNPHLRTLFRDRKNSWMSNRMIELRALLALIMMVLLEKARG